ncbi:MAG: hypothetical protein LBC44_00120 [Mycoplasmataceae bacterium]|jgi:phosphotransferase system IIB component|nr:hypothetical protein [Mycoplasmataceae bacterium]
MSGKYYFLSIITFGIYPIIIASKAKKNQQINTQLSYSSKAHLNVDNFVADLGGKDNLVSVSSTISTLNVELKNPVKLPQEKLNSYKIKGAVYNGKKINFVTGDNAFAIAQEIKKLIA